MQACVPHQHVEIYLTQYSVDDVAILVDFLQPSLHVDKAFSVGDIVDNDDPVSTPIVPTREMGNSKGRKEREGGKKREGN